MGKSISDRNTLSKAVQDGLWQRLDLTVQLVSSRKLRQILLHHTHKRWGWQIRGEPLSLWYKRPNTVFDSEFGRCHAHHECTPTIPGTLSPGLTEHIVVKWCAVPGAHHLLDLHTQLV